MTPEEIDEFFHPLEIGENLNLVEEAAAGFSGLGLESALAGWPRVKVVFRGQRDARWGLTSSLARAVSKGDHSNLREERLGSAERRILEAARQRVEGSAVGSWLGRNLTDGELLAVLQHQEAPTRFIDVTTDPLVALYFAADAEDSLDGRIFAIVIRDDDASPTRNAAEREGSRLLLDASEELPWPTVNTPQNAPGEWTNSLYYVDAGRLDPRMTAQEGLFIVGGLPRSYAKFALPAVKASKLPHISSIGMGFRSSVRQQYKINSYATAYAWSIRVPGVEKAAIRATLRNDYQITHESLFPEYREFKRLAHHLAGLVNSVSDPI